MIKNKNQIIINLFLFVAILVFMILLVAFLNGTLNFHGQWFIIDYKIKFIAYEDTIEGRKAISELIVTILSKHGCKTSSDIVTALSSRESIDSIIYEFNVRRFDSTRVVELIHKGIEIYTTNNNITFKLDIINHDTLNNTCNHIKAVIDNMPLFFK